VHFSNRGLKSNPRSVYIAYKIANVIESLFGVKIMFVNKERLRPYSCSCD